jgi:cytochrome c oxidase subunit II
MKIDTEILSSLGSVLNLAQQEVTSERGWLRSFLLKDSNSDIGQDYWGVDNLFMVVTWLNIIFFLVVVVPMCYWAWKYRRKPGVAQQRTPNHNTALEVTWIVGPLVILVGIFFWGFQGYMKAQIAKGGAELITVEGWKWGWGATYKNGAGSGVNATLDDRRIAQGTGELVGQSGNGKVPVFVIPEGKPVKFLLQSRDVMHSFYIPDMRVKMDLFPNRYTSMTFTPLSATKPDGVANVSFDGTFAEGTDHYVFCAEYCGQLHSEMAAIIRVQKPSDYDATIAAWGNVKDTLNLVDLGKYIYERKCATCHSVDGSKNSGPSWKGYYGTDVKFTDGSSIMSVYGQTGDMELAWANYIRESILNPAKKIHEGYANQMNSFAGQLSDRELEGIAAYIRDLNGKSKAEDKAPPAAKK